MAAGGAGGAGGASGAGGAGGAACCAWRGCVGSGGGGTALYFPIAMVGGLAGPWSLTLETRDENAAAVEKAT